MAASFIPVAFCSGSSLCSVLSAWVEVGVVYWFGRWLIWATTRNRLARNDAAAAYHATGHVLYACSVFCALRRGLCCWCTCCRLALTLFYHWPQALSLSIFCLWRSAEVVCPSRWVVLKWCLCLHSAELLVLMPAFIELLVLVPASAELPVLIFRRACLVSDACFVQNFSSFWCLHSQGFSMSAFRRACSIACALFRRCYLLGSRAQAL